MDTGSHAIENKGDEMMDKVKEIGEKAREEFVD